MQKKSKSGKKDKPTKQIGQDIVVGKKILGFGFSEEEDLYLKYGNAEKPSEITEKLAHENELNENENPETLYGASTNQYTDLSGYYKSSGGDEFNSSSIGSEIKYLDSNIESNNNLNEYYKFEQNELQMIFDRLFNRNEHDVGLFINLIQFSYSSNPASDAYYLLIESFFNKDRLKSLKTIRFLFELVKKQKLIEFNENRIILTVLNLVRKFQLIELKDIVEEELLSENPNIRALSISIFGEWREKEILQNLENLLLDPNPEIKIAVIKALANYRDTNFNSVILNMVENENFEVLTAIVAFFIEISGNELINKVPYLVSKLKDGLEQHVSYDKFLFYKELVKYIKIYHVDCDYYSLLEMYLLFIENGMDSEEIFRGFIYLQRNNRPIRQLVLEFMKMPRWKKYSWKLEEMVGLMGL